MPNDQNFGDRKLSELLDQAEPPKSPEHLDETILSYARENAPAVTTKSPWQFLSTSAYWLNQHWVSALTTVSVAVIAVSISLQNLRTSSEPATFAPSSPARTLEVAPNRELAQSDSIRQEQVISVTDAAADEPVTEAEKISDANLAQVTSEQQRTETASPQALATAQLSRLATSIEESNAPVASAAQNEPLPIEPQLVAEERAQRQRSPAASAIAQPLANAAQTSDERVEQLNPADAQQIASNDIATNTVEEVVVSGAFVRSSSGFTAASPITQIASQELSSYPQFTEESRDQFVSILNRALISFDEVDNASSNDADSVVYSQEVVDSLIVAFNELETIPAMAAAGNRYAEARSGFTEFQLPEDLASAIQLLQLVQSESSR